MSMLKYPYILYFIDGTMPSPDDQLAADQLSPCKVAFRNARLVPDAGSLEKADGWFGDATPARYKKEYPHAEKAIKAFVEARQKHFDDQAEAQHASKVESAEGLAKSAEADAVAAKKKADDEAAAAQKKIDEAKAAKAKAAEVADAGPAKPGKAQKAAAKADWKPNA